MDAYTLAEMQSWFSADEVVEDEPLFVEAERLEAARKEAERKERARRAREKQRLKEDRAMVALADREAALARLLEDDDDDEPVQLNDLEKDGPIRGWLFGGPPQDEMTGKVRVDFVNGVGYQDGDGLGNGDEQVEAKERADEYAKKCAEEAAKEAARVEDIRKREEEIQRRKDAESASRLRDMEREEEVMRIEAMLAELKTRRAGERAEAARKKKEEDARAAKLKEKEDLRKQLAKEQAAIEAETKKKTEAENLQRAVRQEAMRQREERCAMGQQDAASAAYAIASVLAEEERQRKLAFLGELYTPFVGYFDDDGHERSNFTPTGNGSFAFTSVEEPEKQRFQQLPSLVPQQDSEVDGMLAGKSVRMSESAPMLGLDSLPGHKGKQGRRLPKDGYSIPYASSVLETPEFPALAQYAVATSVTDSLVERMIYPSASANRNINSRGQFYDPTKTRQKGHGPGISAVKGDRDAIRARTAASRSRRGISRSDRGISGLGKSINDIPQLNRPGTVSGVTRRKQQSRGKGIGKTSVRPSSREEAVDDSMQLLARERGLASNFSPGRSTHGLQSRGSAISSAGSMSGGSMRFSSSVNGNIRPSRTYADGRASTAGAGIGAEIPLHSQHTHTFTSQINRNPIEPEEYKPGFHQVRREEAVLIEGQQRKREDIMDSGVVGVDELGMPSLPAPMGPPTSPISESRSLAQSMQSTRQQPEDRSVFIGGGYTGLNAVPRLGVKGRPQPLHETELQKQLTKSQGLQ